MLRRKMPAAAVIIAVMVMLTPDTALAQLYGNRLASKDGKWLLPVASLHLTSTEADHIRRGSVQAWDITAPKGTPIFPIADGVVEYAGCDNKGGYGCWTYIRHEGGIHTIMGHMIQGSIVVKAGQQVSQWDVVGQVGWTGMTSFGPHVHLEIHKPGGGRYNISDFWDINAMHYAKLSNAESNEVITDIGVIAADGQQVAAQAQPAPVTTVADATGSVLLWQVALLQIKTMPPAVLGGAILALLFLLFLMTEQFRQLTIAVMVCGIVFVVVFEVPTANLKASGYGAGEIADAQAIQNNLPAQFANNKDAKDIANLWSRHRDLIAQLAKETQIPMSAIVGTLMTESRGVGIVNGRMKIRLETHQFYKFLGNDALFNKYFRIPPSGKARFLEASYWNGSGWANVHGSQDDEYAAFQIAAGLNEEAAYRALSMGAPQIFGDNYRMFGYGSAKEMYTDMASSERVQIINMFKYIAKVNHLGSLRSGNYEAFVANYNGPGNVATYTGLVRKYESLFKQMVSATVLQ